jgi:hypothetical protein
MKDKSDFIVLETLADVINQACLQDDDETLDSMAVSAYADGLRVLADFNRVEIITQAGRRVIAKWKKSYR